MTTIKLTTVQKNYLRLLAEAGPDGIVAHEENRLAKKLVELGLAAWKDTLHPLKGQYYLAITPAGRALLDAGEKK